MCACKSQLPTHPFIRNVKMKSKVRVNSSFSTLQRCCPIFSSILLNMKSYVDQLLSASHFVVACEFKKRRCRRKHSPQYPNEFLRIFTNFNPLMGTLKPQSNGPLYSNMVISTLAVDGWAVTFSTVRRGVDAWTGCGPAQSPPRCTKCNSPPTNGQCTNFIYSMWHYNYQCSLKG